jgi:AcrR family transcriptional regulator
MSRLIGGTSMTVRDGDVTPGLRERKKARTRDLIQRHALRLFHDHGYDATTVEDICQAAEVSDTTFYRYFGSKAHVVLWDEFNRLLIGAFKAQPSDLSPVRALRFAFRQVFSSMTPQQHEEQRQRINLLLALTELRAVMFDQLLETFRSIAAFIAERTGQPPTDLAVRTLAGAVSGATLAVMFALADDPEADIATLFDQSIGHLEHELS